MVTGAAYCSFIEKKEIGVAFCNPFLDLDEAISQRAYKASLFFVIFGLNRDKHAIAGHQKHGLSRFLKPQSDDKTSV